MRVPPPRPSLLSLLLHPLPHPPIHTNTLSDFLITSLVLYFLLGSILPQQEGKWNCFQSSMEIPLRTSCQKGLVYRGVLQASAVHAAFRAEQV